MANAPDRAPRNLDTTNFLDFLKISHDALRLFHQPFPLYRSISGVFVRPLSAETSRCVYRFHQTRRERRRRRQPSGTPTFLLPRPLPGERPLVEQRAAALDQVLPAERAGLFGSALRPALQTVADVPQTGRLHVFADVGVHLGDGVFDQPQTFLQAPVLLRVGCGGRSITV